MPGHLWRPQGSAESSGTPALLPRAVGAPSLEVPKAVDGALGSLNWGQQPAHCRGWGWGCFEVPSDTIILCFSDLFSSVTSGGIGFGRAKGNSGSEADDETQLTFYTEQYRSRRRSKGKNEAAACAVLHMGRRDKRG